MADTSVLQLPTTQNHHTPGLSSSVSSPPSAAPVPATVPPGPTYSGERVQIGRAYGAAETRYALATQKLLSRSVSVVEFGDLERARASWSSASSTDIHMLFQLEPMWDICEVESFVATEAGRGALEQEALRQIQWQETRSVLKKRGWQDPTPEHDLGDRVVGLRLHVEGHGEGSCEYFSKQSMGPSEHIVKFLVPVPVQGSTEARRVKLRRKANAERQWLWHPAAAAEGVPPPPV